MLRVLKCSKCSAAVHVSIRQALDIVMCPNGHENMPGSFAEQVREFAEREDPEKSR